MAHHVIRGFLLWAAIASLASSTSAQVPVVPGARGPGSAAAPPPAAQQAVVAEPQILLAPVDPDEKVVVWGGVRLQFSLVNGSLNSGIGTKSLALSLPPALPLKAPGRQARTDGTIDMIPIALDLRVPGERRDFAPVELVGKSFKELGWWQVVSILTYRPRKEVFFATLEYQGLADRKPGTRTARLVVTTAAHPLGMYAGAVVGSFLSSLFLLLYAISQPPQVPPALHPIWQFLLRFVRGIIATAIALFFVFQTTSELSLPVNVSVQDFYGGVLLGLFGDKIAELLIKKITGP